MPCFLGLVHPENSKVVILGPPRHSGMSISQFTWLSCKELGRPIRRSDPLDQ